MRELLSAAAFAVEDTTGVLLELPRAAVHGNAKASLLALGGEGYFVLLRNGNHAAHDKD